MIVENWGYEQPSSSAGGSGLITVPDAGAVNALAVTSTDLASLEAGNVFTVTNIVASNNSSASISINSATPINIVGSGGSLLQGGELTIGCDAEFIKTSTGLICLLGTTNGTVQVKSGTQSNHAINLGQLTASQNNDLKTANNLSEIFNNGSSAQTSARTNIGAQQSGISLITSNLLSEIAALGSTAQSTAQSNLGITGGGVGGGTSGRLLGIALISTSQTFTLASGTNTIIAEVIGGGGGCLGLAATDSTHFGYNLPGLPGAWALVEIPVSQLSTGSSGTVIIGIGAGGASTNSLTVSNSGSATTIDTSVVIAAGGAGAVTSPSGSGNYTNTAVNITYPSGTLSAVSVVSPSVILKTKTSADYLSKLPITMGTFSATSLLVANSTGGNVGVSCYSISFFDSNNTFPRYGVGGNGSFLPISQPARGGNAGIQGAVRLWMYS
jgi:hypothetical protein